MCEISLAGKRAFLTIGTQSGIGKDARQALIFELIAFDHTALIAGRRFVAHRQTSGRSTANRDTLMSGHLRRFEKLTDAYSFECTGELKGLFALRSIRLRGEDCYLFSQINTGVDGGLSR